MKLYLLRHGTAEEQKSGSTDAARQLTGAGKAEVARVVATAARAGVRPTLILTSPLIRARQTADIAHDGFHTTAPLLVTDSLKPDGPPHIVWAELSDHRKEESVLLVSHNPLAEQLVPYFLNTPTLQFSFAKGAFVAIEVSNFRGDPDGVLEWVLTPDLTQA